MTDQRFENHDDETMRRLRDLEDHLKEVFAARRRDPARRAAFLAKLAVQETAPSTDVPRPAAASAGKRNYIARGALHSHSPLPRRARTSTRPRSRSRTSIDRKTVLLAALVAVIRLVASVMDRIGR